MPRLFQRQEVRNKSFLLSFPWYSHHQRGLTHDWHNSAYTPCLSSWRQHMPAVCVCVCVCVCFSVHSSSTGPTHRFMSAHGAKSCLPFRSCPRGESWLELFRDAARGGWQGLGRGVGADLFYVTGLGRGIKVGPFEAVPIRSSVRLATHGIHTAEWKLFEQGER